MFASMQPITVIGAGFSGLVTAYFLTKAGCRVQVFEKSSRPGGLIQTIRTEHGLIETAANGILNSARLEAMCADIGVPLLAARRDGRKRFIYRDKPRQLPLNTRDAARLAFRVVRNATGLRPQQFETIAGWGNRVLGRGATDYVLAPALAGIYAGDINRLSASLIFGQACLPDHLRTSRPKKARLRGIVAPPHGMQQLIDGLVNYLKDKGVEFIFEKDARSDLNQPTIVCLSASSASLYLKNSAPEIASALGQIEMLSLVTATCFLDDDAASLNGFGCLFPVDQGFRARGVLFNDCIFEGRGPAQSETWIFGGALDPEIVTFNEDELTALISGERQRLFQKDDHPLATHVTRWPRALPHYSVELERILATLATPPPNVALVGNYLGRIGLAKIIERAAYLAGQFAKMRSEPGADRGRYAGSSRGVLDATG
jgi:oxygen-dependent protoporphyrinogen oxidase